LNVQEEHSSEKVNKEIKIGIKDYLELKEMSIVG
jgi:hypothetical protein